MAAQPPTVQSLQNWEDAFVHYQLPTVRALERDLRKNIDENRSKLRSLVGASYRDLLGTAERIIEMDGQMTTLEHGLVEMGRKCDARRLEKSGSNWAGMKKRTGGGDQAQMAVMAQTKVLQGCLTVVGRVVKARGDALLGAKVLVLARLLAKSMDGSQDTPGVLDELKKKLGSLRKRLLAYIERNMTRSMTDKTALASTLCAYALVTSSTPKEVLRHFLRVRFRQLESRADSPGEAEVTDMLDLYSRTLLDTKDVFPRRFADALLQLGRIPLMRDAQVLACEGLNLDIYGQWIADDVRTFTPWVRHDQVTGSETSDALRAWTKQAHECLLAGLEEYLEKQEDLSAVVAARHAVLTKFMGLSSRLRDQDHGAAIDNIRETFLTRMKMLASESAGLTDLQPDRSESSAQQLSRQDSLWDLAKDNMDLSGGARGFRNAIMRRRHGRDTVLDREIERLDAWNKRIEQSLDCIDNARSRKWNDDLDFDIDDLDDGDALLEALSKSDPEAATQSLRDAVESTCAKVASHVQSVATTTTNAAHVLRVWREFDKRVRRLQTRLTLTPTEISLQALHRNLAQGVARPAMEEYAQALKGPASHVATSLWDGTPPLPVQPSPAAFKFLAALHRAMSEAGDDLWSADCVVELRKVVDESLGEAESRVDGDASSDLTNGHADADGEDASVHVTDEQTKRQNRLLQTLFDRLYLRQVFHPDDEDSSSSSVIGSAIEGLKKQTEVDEASSQRMSKSAEGCWARTHLLFGLLAHTARSRE